MAPEQNSTDQYGTKKFNNIVVTLEEYNEFILNMVIYLYLL